MPAGEFPEDELPWLRTIAMPADANPSGDIFGGWIMSQMDLAGSIFASYLTEGRLVTVAVEGMTFHLPVFVGDQVSCYCERVRTGRTSIAVSIEAWVRRRQTGEQHLKVTEATYTYVRVDEQRKPIPLVERKR
ncbi:MAG: acyl-CoA thioesterase [Gammaproteobacteria bacterium]|nr:acyl-CoA thioesterase [Gammaproteobacteria bacterium]MDA8007900.1 acyl-CoA thioesterase [Gammaproteobacteria bacterium]MDA8011683.1 acyl-CoA thioesterase [Gammaproteobacteria bacterium]